MQGHSKLTSLRCSSDPHEDRRKEAGFNQTGVSSCCHFVWSSLITLHDLRSSSLFLDGLAHSLLFSQRRVSCVLDIGQKRSVPTPPSTLNNHTLRMQYKLACIILTSHIIVHKLIIGASQIFYQLMHDYLMFTFTLRCR